jgi:peptide deformylase
VILKIRYYGDPILRQIAQPVGAITDEVREICHNLVETILHYDGIGLAAPQVGILLRNFVTNVESEDEKGELHLGEPKIYINPELSTPGSTIVDRSEGCLSIPKLYLAIPRPLTIRLDALDINGNPFHEECYGYQARNRMHEVDHLNGVLFVDRVKGKRRTEIEPTLRRIKQQYSSKPA